MFYRNFNVFHCLNSFIDTYFYSSAVFRSLRCRFSCFLLVSVRFVAATPSRSWQSDTPPPLAHKHPLARHSTSCAFTLPSFCSLPSVFSFSHAVHYPVFPPCLFPPLQHNSRTSTPFRFHISSTRLYYAVPPLQLPVLSLPSSSSYLEISISILVQPTTTSPSIPSISAHCSIPTDLPTSLTSLKQTTQTSSQSPKHGTTPIPLLLPSSVASPLLVSNYFLHHAQPSLTTILLLPVEELPSSAGTCCHLLHSNFLTTIPSTLFPSACLTSHISLLSSISIDHPMTPHTLNLSLLSSMNSHLYLLSQTPVPTLSSPATSTSL